MPIPKPNSGESETDFMARCMDSSTMRNEYSQRDQRVAVCSAGAATVTVKRRL